VSTVTIHTQHERWRVTFRRDGEPTIERWDLITGWVPWEPEGKRHDNDRRRARIIARAEALRL
jgi:hypothetical protein